MSTSDVSVLVVFYSRLGTTERLALAAGLGAIQSRANIRLRRLAGHADAAAIEASPECKPHVDRMNRDYVEPRPADPVWADVIVLATPAYACTEVEAYCSSLRSLGSMAGKIAAPLAAGGADAALGPLYAAAACAGMIVVPAGADDGDPITTARACGAHAVAMARVLKASRPRP